MKEKLEAYLQEVVQLSEEDSRLMSSLATPIRVKKRQLLLKEGAICYHKMFVVTGLMKVYKIGNQGAEHILRFVQENEFMTDLESFLHHTPSKYNVEALETSQVLTWTREQLTKVVTAVPAFKAWSEQLLLKNFNAGHERLLQHISTSTEEKYQDFIASFPDIVRRVPLHMIASYLGVSRETLTRIRHAQLR
jgi:CRP-like cAMP-binding protein